jgi:hypothetical protein
MRLTEELETLEGSGDQIIFNGVAVDTARRELLLHKVFEEGATVALDPKDRDEG